MASVAFRLALVAVASVAAVAVVALAGPAAHAGDGGCRPAPTGTGRASAAEVQRRFLRTAVVRRFTVCSYDLVTAAVRAGLTRRQWATGTIPVQPFPSRDPAHVAMRIEPHLQAPSQLASWVELESDDLGPATFELVLVARGGRWLVDYWAPLPRTGAASAAG
jgi:hypothetical protein